MASSGSFISSVHVKFVHGLYGIIDFSAAGNSKGSTAWECIDGPGVPMAKRLFLFTLAALCFCVREGVSPLPLALRHACCNFGASGEGPAHLTLLSTLQEPAQQVQHEMQRKAVAHDHRSLYMPKSCGVRCVSYITVLYMAYSLQALGSIGCK